MLEQELWAAVFSSSRHLWLLPCPCFSLTFPAAGKVKLALTLHHQRSPLGFPGRCHLGCTGQRAGHHLNRSLGAEVSQTNIVLFPCLSLPLEHWLCCFSDFSMEGLIFLFIVNYFFFFLGERLLFSWIGFWYSIVLLCAPQASPRLCDPDLLCPRPTLFPCPRLCWFSVPSYCHVKV